MWAHAWAHPSVLERRKSEAPRFKDFERDGDLTIVERIGADVADVASIVGEVYAAGILDKIGVDTYGIGAINEAIEEQGVPADAIVGVSQGWKLSGAIKTTERKLAEGVIEHAGSPLMSWCVGNARVEPKGNAVSITKQASGFAKIDPLMAVFDAITLMAMNPASQQSFWETA